MSLEVIETGPRAGSLKRTEGSSVNWSDLPENVLPEVWKNLPCKEKVDWCSPADAQGFPCWCKNNAELRKCIFGREVTAIGKFPSSRQYGIKADVIELVHDESNSIDRAIDHYAIAFEEAINDFRDKWYEDDNNSSKDEPAVLFMLEVRLRPYLWRLLPGLFTRMFCETYDLVTTHLVVKHFKGRLDYVDEESLKTMSNDPKRDPMGHILVSSAMLKVMEFEDEDIFDDYCRTNWKVVEDRVILEWSDYSSYDAYDALYQHRTEVKITFSLAGDRSFKNLRMQYRTVPSIVSDGGPPFVFEKNKRSSYLVLGVDTELCEDGSPSAKTALYRRLKPISEDVDEWEEIEGRSLHDDDGDVDEASRARIRDIRKLNEELFQKIMSTNAPLVAMRDMRDDRLSSFLNRRLYA